MSNKNAMALIAVTIVATAIATGSWFETRSMSKLERSVALSSELQPLAALLQENQQVLDELRADPFSEKDSGILESYLLKIRREGVPKHADMKQRLDQLAENNTAIATLIEAYAPHAKTSSFAPEGDKFSHYAAAWRDRWNSVMELFMAGGNYATSEVPPPKGFATAVDAEIAATR